MSNLADNAGACPDTINGDHDWLTFDRPACAVIEEAAATKDYEARMGAVKGAMILADRLDEHGCRTVQDLGRLQEHG